MNKEIPPSSEQRDSTICGQAMLMNDNPEERKLSVISVGTLPDLLSLRAAVLHSAGYTVFTTTSPEEAQAKMGKGDCGVLLLCYSVSDEWRKPLIQQFREHCPEGRIIAITNRPVTETPKEVDELVYGIEGPEILLDAVQGIDPHFRERKLAG